MPKDTRATSTKRIAAMASELTAHARVPWTQRPWWPAATRTVSALFLAVVLWLIVRYARSVQWHAVAAAIADYPATTLVGAAALALASHLLYATFDLLSRRYTGHKLPGWRVLVTALISYAFNLNFGSLVGGIALRARLYSRQGLSAARISRIVGFSMLTNWLGYLVLAGLCCLLQPIAVPEAWALGAGALRGLGVLLIATALAYVGLCFASPRRSFALRGHHLHLPSGRVAVLQLVVSALNWCLIGATVYLLLRPHVDYAAALTALLGAAVAGVATHVPGGLGVLEAVFLALLTPLMAESTLLAALLVYRAVYYLVPLALASLLYLAFELRLKPSSA